MLLFSWILRAGSDYNLKDFELRLKGINTLVAKHNQKMEVGIQEKIENDADVIATYKEYMGVS